MSIQSDLEGNPESADTDEQTLAKLLKLEALELHTQIDKPDPMTALDAYGEYAGHAIAPCVNTIVSGYQFWKRKNMAAYQRGRAKEIVDAIKAKTEEKKARTAEALALGRATR